MNKSQPLKYSVTRSNIYYYETANELLLAAEMAVKNSDVVLDIGCGIRPMNYFRPKLHLMIEPYKEYVDILAYRCQGDKSSIILHQGALEGLKGLADNSVDSIFLLDVIEHIEKEEGLIIVKECERVAREQIVIFTPLGFMPQEIEKDEIDAWGLNGGTFQHHLSGWIPDDFSSDWFFYICNEFHHIAANGEALNAPYGAFFAIRNFNKKAFAVPEKLSKLSIPFFSAYDAEKFYHENNSLRAQIQSLQGDLLHSNEQLSALFNSRSMRFLRKIKNILVFLGMSSLSNNKGFASKANNSDNMPLKSLLNELENMSLTEKFSVVYQENVFAGKISRSGEGSNLIQTAVIRREIPKLLAELNVSAILDAPCGDWHWMRETKLNIQQYVGVDIVQALINKNQLEYGNDNIHFKCSNLISDKLPKVNLILSRDCFVHLSYEDIYAIVNNFKASGAKYLLTTTFTDRKYNQDLDMLFWRPLNLQLPPFNFPPPIRVINEGCTEENNMFTDKSLGLWHLEDLPDYVQNHV